MQTNPAEKKRNVRGSVDPNVSAWDRVNEFKDQCLTTVSGNLRCDACRETLSKEKSSVKKHVSSIKHIKALENIKKSKKKDQNIKDLLAKTSRGAKGSTLPEDMRPYRYELVEALPNWSAAVKKILLVQPSSASAERVFSLLQNAFSKQQEAALEETVETSVMLRYNDNKRT